MVLIAESLVDQGDVGVDSGIMFGLQIPDYFCRFFLSSRNGLSVGEIGVEGPAVSGKLDCFLKLRDCLVVHVLLLERLA